MNDSTGSYLICSVPWLSFYSPPFSPYLISLFLTVTFLIFRLTALATEFNFVLVVDDTIGNFSNIDLFHSEGESQ